MNNDREITLRELARQYPVLLLDLESTIKGLKAIVRDGREAARALTVLREAKEAYSNDRRTSREPEQSTPRPQSR